MVAGCGMKIVKLVMFAVNVAVWAAGCVILSLGSWIKAYEAEYEDLLGSDNIKSITITMIVAGCIIFCIGFCGCCGAWKEIPFLLKIYFVLMILAVIIETVAGIMALVYRDDVYADIKKQMTKQLNEEYGKTTAITESIDELQEELYCCGANNYTDYANARWAGTPGALGKAVPETCCKFPPSVGCNDGTHGYPSSVDSIYEKGCVDAMDDWIGERLTILGGVCLGLLAIQILAMVLSCCLVRAIEEEK